MQAEERKKRIAEITKNVLFSTDNKGKRLRYCGEVKTFVEYEIPIELLVFNVENGRIASMVKSFEREHSSLNPEVPQHAQQIAQFLFDSNEPANEKTKKSIAENGQLETGIITSDGVIVDGNRRASLMLSILHDEKNYTPAERARCEKFRAVVLPEDANEKEILRLETTYQMGADEKVGYNPIEKYLKTRDLRESGFMNEDIADFMGISKTQVKENLEILDLIDDYLSTYGYDGIYTMAVGHEDSFQKLRIALKSYENGVAEMWDCTKADRNELKIAAFDYIRLGLEQTAIRDLFRKPSRTNSSIFGSKSIWESFKEKYNDALIEEKPVEQWIEEHPGEDIDKVLKARDDSWRRRSKEKLEGAFRDSQETLSSRLQAKEPERLVNKAFNAISSIDVGASSFKNNASSISSGLQELIELAQQLLNAANEQ